MAGDRGKGKYVIRFDNFNVQYSAIKEEIDGAIHRVLDSGWFILGKELETFEKEFAQYIGCKYCVGVGSGTDAITLALMALDIGQGHEVITSDMTAFPTVSGIMKAGAVPVLAEIFAEDGLIDPDKIESKITKNTRAIMPVHLYGQSCDMDAICRIARDYKLQVIEDCAQSVGSTYKGKRTGTIGVVNAFSFYPTKNLGAYGDGGAVTTDDETIFQKLLQLRNYGQRTRYYHDHFGINSRLDEIQAAVLKVKLKYLDEWNRGRLDIAHYYREHIDAHKVTCMRENPYGTPVYHLFVIKTKERDRMIELLKNKGIQNLIHYPVPIHRQKGLSSPYKIDDSYYPQTIEFAEQILSIPIYPELTRQDRQAIVESVNSIEG
jgi:dTDP-4-amino-4,6-dideoxygalactose transaminase